MIDLFPQFLLYSFLGFLLEVTYARWRGKGGRGRKGFLFLPLCPVYGLGALAIVTLPPLFLTSPLLVFVAGGMMATLVEMAVGLFYRAVGTAFWDYQNEPANLAGVVCPRFTLCWGLLSLGLVYGVHPLVASLLAQVPPSVTLVLFPALAADGLLSLWLLHRTGTPESLRWYRAFYRSHGAREAT